MSERTPEVNCSTEATLAEQIKRMFRTFGKGLKLISWDPRGSVREDNLYPNETGRRLSDLPCTDPHSSGVTDEPESISWFHDSEWYL